MDEIVKMILQRVNSTPDGIVLYGGFGRNGR